MRKLNFTHLVTYLENEEINTIYNRYFNTYKKGLITKREIEFMFQKEIMKQFPEFAFEICTNTDF